MAEDANANIRIDIDTSEATAALKALQGQIARFHTEMARGGAAAAQVSSRLQNNLVNSINAGGQFQAGMVKVQSTTEAFTTALEKNKLSMGQYFRYAGAATKTFGKFFGSEFQTITKVATERVKDLQTQYISMGRDANGALQSIKVRPLVLDMKSLTTQTMLATQKQQLYNQLLKQGSTNLLNFGKNTQWAGRQLMVGFTIPLTMFAAAAAKSFMDIEKQIIKIRRVYGDFSTTVEQTDEMVKSIRTLASEYTKYGVAVKDTIELASNAAAAGKTGQELLAQVSEATRLAVLGNVDQTQALETTMSVTNAFGTATEDLAKKIDFLNAVENQSVTSIEDLTIAIPKAGPVVQQLGGDVEDLAFFLTAMKEGGINASEGANALKSGLAALINPTGKAKEMLQGFGINIENIVNSNKGDIKGLVVDFASALDTLDPLSRARAIEQLFGKFQFSRLSTLFQNVIGEGTQASRVLELTKATTQELAILSQRELKKVEDTTTYKFEKAFADFQNALAPVGEEFLKVVTPIIEFGTKLLQQFNSMGDGAKAFTVILTTVVAGIGPALLMTVGLVANGVANLIKMFAFMGNLFKKTGSDATNLGLSTDYMTQQQIEAAAVAASLGQSHSRLTQVFSVEAAALNNLTLAYQKAITAQQGFGVGGGRVAGSATKPKKFATGGVVRGPGSGTSDSIPAMLSNGEAVIPAKQVKKYSGFIQSMIAGNVPGFARGGFIGKMLSSNKPKSKNFFSELIDSIVGKKIAAPTTSLRKSGEVILPFDPNLSSQQISKLMIEAQLKSAKTKIQRDQLQEKLEFGIGRRGVAGPGGTLRTGDPIYDDYLKYMLEVESKQAVADFIAIKSAAGKKVFKSEIASIEKLVYEKFVKQNSALRDQTFLSMNSSNFKPNTGGGDSPYASLAAFGFNKGVVSVPGPKGAGDVVPAMLSPGEAVIPTKMAKKYGGLINGMITGNIPGYEQGLKTYTNAVMYLPSQMNADMRPGSATGGVDPSKLAASIRGGGAALQAPLVEALARSMGATNQTQIRAMIENNPELRKIAGRISTGVATEVGNLTGKVTDADLEKIAKKQIRAKVKGTQFAGAAEDFLTRKTMFEDPTVRRLKGTSSGGRGRFESMGRAPIDTGGQGYKQKSPTYKKIFSMLGGRNVEKYDLAHITAAETLPASKVKGTSTELKAAKEDIKNKTQRISLGKHPETGQNLGRITVPAGISSAEKRALYESERAKLISSGATTSKPSSGRGTRKPSSSRNITQATTPAQKRQATIAAKKEAVLKAAAEAQAKRDAINARRREQYAAKKAAAQPPAPKPGIGSRIASGIKGMGGMGLGMGVSMAGGAVAMIPGLEGLGSALGMIGPLFMMLPTPIAAVVGGLGLLVAGVFALNAAQEEQRKKAVELGNSLGMNSKTLQAMSDDMGTVSLTQKRQAETSELLTRATEEQTSAARQYLTQTDSGKKLLEEVKNLQTTGISAQETGEIIGNKISYAISQNVITREQGDGIIAALGTLAGNFAISTAAAATVENTQNLPIAQLAQGGARSTLAATNAQVANFDPNNPSGGLSLASSGLMSAYSMALGGEDIINSRYDELLKELEVDKEKAKTKKEELDIQKEIDGLGIKRKTDLLAQRDLQNEIRDSVKITFGIIDGQVSPQANAAGGILTQPYLDMMKTTYAEDSPEYRAAQALMTNDNATKFGTDFLINIGTSLATGDLSPTAMTNFLSYAAENKTFATEYNAMITASGDIETLKTIGALQAAGAEGKTITVALALINDGASVEDVLGATTSLLSGQVSGINVEVDDEALKTYIEDLKSIKESMPQDGKFTTEFIAEYIGDKEAADAIADSEAFQKLPKKKKAEYIATYKAFLTGSIDKGSDAYTAWKTLMNKTGEDTSDAAFIRWTLSKIEGAGGSGGNNNGPDTTPETTTGGGGSSTETVSPLERRMNRINAKLKIISLKEAKINKKYEERKKALEEIAKLNEQILAQQKDQLDVADALSRGDIAAAARAAQQYRTNEAQRAKEAQAKALEDAQKNELAGVTFKGKTRAQLEAMLAKLEMRQARREYRNASGGGIMKGYAGGGMIRRYSVGGKVMSYLSDGGSPLGSDTIPAMLTPGEFVVKRPAVKNFGVKNLEAINNGSASGSSGVYNYSISVNVNTDADPDQIARAVAQNVKRTDSYRIRGNRL